MPAHHTILSLSTKGSTFFGDLTIPFADGLNTFMGGCGCGKTSIAWFLRYAIGAAIPPGYQKECDNYVKDILGTGTVSVHLRTCHGVEYTASRAYGEAPKVRNAAGELVDVSLDGELFRIEAYAAKEIEQIARSPSAQLTLLDRLAAPEEIRRLNHALDDSERRLALSGAEVDRLTAEIAVDEEREAGRPALLEALKGVALGDAGPDGGELAHAEARRPARGRENTAMKGLATEVANAQRSFDQCARESLRRLAAASLADLEGTQAPIGPLFAGAHDAVRQAAGAIEATTARLVADLTQAAEKLAVGSRALLAIHDKEDEAYKAIVVRKDTDRERSMQREALHRQRDALDAVAQRLALCRSERDRKQAAHGALVEERNALLNELYRLRASLAAYITQATGEQVEVTVKRGGIVTRYHELLVDIVQGSGLPATLLQEIADGVAPDELYAAVLRDDPEPIAQVDPAKSGKTARAYKVMMILRDSGRMREIERCRLDDMPRMQLKVDGNYQPSARASTGQRCTSVLPPLLLPSINPLIVDQIEDHLDNAFIFGVLVTALLAAKEGRQFIFISHNANIGVLGNAERAFELQVRDGKGVLAAHGNVEEMRERFESCLEGGREAFVLRGQRYGHLPKDGGAVGGAEGGAP